MYGQTLTLETHPDQDQRDRLRDFLAELMIISRKYGILIETHHEGEKPMLVDIRSDTVLGVDLSYVVHGDYVRAYECDMSVFDGAWPVGDGTHRQDGKPTDATTTEGARAVNTTQLQRQDAVRS